MIDLWDTAVITSSASVAHSERVESFNVLHFLPPSNNAEVLRDVLEISDKLSKEGCGSIIASEGELDIKGQDIVNLPFTRSPFKRRKNLLKLIKVIKEKKVDIIHMHAPFSKLGGALVCNQKNVKIVASVYKARTTKIPFIGSSCAKKILSLADMVIGATSFVALKTREKYHISEAKVRVVYEGIDTEHFSLPDNASLSLQEIRKEFDIPLDAKVILAPLKNMETLKGQEQVLEAVQKIKEQDWVLVFLGEFDNPKNFGLKELEKQVSAFGFNNKIRFVRSYKDFKKIYALADVVLFASTNYVHAERQVIKAEAMGKIVVAADYGGNREVIKGGLTGFLFTPDDVDSLTDTIDRVFNMTTKEKEVMNMTAKNCVLTDFSNQAMCGKMFKLYNELL